jgi:hypothetical protein
MEKLKTHSEHTPTRFGYLDYAALAVSKLGAFSSNGRRLVSSIRSHSGQSLIQQILQTGTTLRIMVQQRFGRSETDLRVTITDNGDHNLQIHRGSSISFSRSADGQSEGFGQEGSKTTAHAYPASDRHGFGHLFQLGQIARLCPAVSPISTPSMT